VLTVVLERADDLNLGEFEFLHETAGFLVGGTHTSSSTLMRTMHFMFERFETHPEEREELLADAGLVQRYVYETLRLYPTSPVFARWAQEDATLSNGRFIPKGSKVEIDTMAANHDRSVFGDDADVFDPRRTLPPGMKPVGISFGMGMHACIGQHIAAGVPAGVGPADERPLGLVPTLAHTLLASGARPHGTKPRQPSTKHSRPLSWDSFPVVLAQSSPVRDGARELAAMPGAGESACPIAPRS
jgi:hypothetical protein